MESHLFAYLYRLRYIERWSLMRNVTRENVAEHSFHVALLTHALCSIANEIYGREVPTDRAVTAALFHDATEVFTGDIPTPVKHHNPDVLSSFREIEMLAAQRLLQLAPADLQTVYAPVLGAKQWKQDQTGQSRDWMKYVKAADLLDAYLKCSTELSAGNREFAVAKKQLELSVERMMRQQDMPELEYFLRHFAPSFDKTLDELSEPPPAD